MTINLSRKVAKFNRNRRLKNETARINAFIIMIMMEKYNAVYGKGKQALGNDYDAIFWRSKNSFRDIKNNISNIRQIKVYYPEEQIIDISREIIDIGIEESEWRRFLNLHYDYEFANRNSQNKDMVESVRAIDKEQMKLFKDRVNSALNNWEIFRDNNETTQRIMLAIMQYYQGELGFEKALAGIDGINIEALENMTDEQISELRRKLKPVILYINERLKKQ